MQAEAELKAKGVDFVLALCVNDAAVMRSWAADQKSDGSFLKFGADVRGEVATALGLTLDARAGLPGKLGYPRCKRFSMLLENNEVKALHVCATSEDPTGDDGPEASFVAQMLTNLGDN